MTNVAAAQWTEIGISVGATALRVFLAVVVALSWTVPMGVAIGTNARLASWLQPAAQIAGSVPATAVFPVLLLVLVRFPGGLNIVAVLLMLLGTQWYLLFNVIAGATAIPQDLKHTTSLLGLNRRETLASPHIARLVSLHRHRSRHGWWRSVECEHRRRIHRVRRTDSICDGNRIIDCEGNCGGRLSTAARSNSEYGAGCCDHQQVRLEAPVQRG